jgi:signal transduction histidine kinase
VGATTVFDDATEVKKLNQLKDNFIALISHQLKTPIGEINGYAYNLLGGVAGKLKPKQLEYATAIQEQAARSGKLIADLLDIALAGEGSLTVQNEPVDVASVVEQVVATRKPLAQQKHLKLESHKVDRDLRARGDEHKLVQVLVNLVDNAIRYTKTGGVTLSVVASDKEVEIYVNDTGTGMDAELREELFGGQTQRLPLIKAPKAEGGTGLGVYLAKQLVALMDGSIRVVSSSSRGTTVAVALKRVEPKGIQ